MESLIENLSTLIDTSEGKICKASLSEVELFMGKYAELVSKSRGIRSAVRKVKTKDRRNNLEKIKSGVVGFMTVDDALCGNAGDEYSLLYKGSLCRVHLGVGLGSVGLSQMELSSPDAKRLRKKEDILCSFSIKGVGLYGYGYGYNFTPPKSLIGTPLTAARDGFADVALSKVIEPEKVSKYIDPHMVFLDKAIKSNVDDYVVVTYSSKVVVLKLSDIRDKIKVSLS